MSLRPNIYHNSLTWYASLGACVESAMSHSFSTFVVYRVPNATLNSRAYDYYWTSEDYANSHDNMKGKYYCTVTTTPR